MEKIIEDQAGRLADLNIQHTLEDPNLPAGMAARVQLDQSSWGEILLQLRVHGLTVAEIPKG